jgi:hypothetical protein
VVRKTVTPEAGQVEAGRWLVEEDHRRAPDQARGQVEPAAHPAGVGAHPAPPRGREAELLEQLRGAPARRGPGQPGQRAHHPQVLLAGLRLVQRGELPGQADAAAYQGPVADDVEPRHPGLPAVWPGQRGQDPHGGRLARPVRPEQREHAAARDAEAEPVEHAHVAVGLDQPARVDRYVFTHDQGILSAYAIRYIA